MMESGINVHVFVDNFEQLRILNENMPKRGGKKWSIYLKVDCGYGRAGADDGDQRTVDLAHQIAQSQHLHGIYAHEGNSYYAKSAEEAAKVAFDAGKRAVAFVNKLKVI